MTTNIVTPKVGLVFYLTENIIGFHSGYVYGMKGDVVKYIARRAEMSLVERADGERFHVRSYKLSDKPVSRDENPLPPPVNRNRPTRNPSRKRRVK